MGQVFLWTWVGSLCGYGVLACTLRIARGGGDVGASARLDFGTATHAARVGDNLPRKRRALLAPCRAVTICHLSTTLCLDRRDRSQERPSAVWSRDRTEELCPPLAILIAARVVLFSIVAGTVAAVGWMINEIHKDDERQRQHRIRERDEEDPGREDA